MEAELITSEIYTRLCDGPDEPGPHESANGADSATEEPEVLGRLAKIAKHGGHGGKRTRTRVFKGAPQSRKKTERRGQKDQEDRRTQELGVSSLPIGDERRVKSRMTVGLIRKKTKSQSPGGGIH
ncbi:hypothetical protein NDU88_003605 [Pleurodeles waltl]|uniref:Uncharacterized protein n=1 Tax=Pleurodeles waltl TaxID=8319 RepID=A0AAV7SGF3_PLEWA|nr:hypothetical protein NDU88_003605 [Pleurodeles waltl]